MRQLALLFRRQSCAPQIRKLPVHVPFYIGNVCAPEDLCYALVDMIHHLRPGQIQHILGTALCGRAAGNLDGPVGMGAVQVRIRRNHFRLKPDTEGKALRLDPFHQRGQAAGEFLFVNCPVSQGAVVQIPVPEPAVVHDQHFDARLLRVPGDLHQLVRVKIKIRGFPVVDQHGTFFMEIWAADQMSPVQVVQGPAHFSQSLIRIDADHLRSLKWISRL